MFLELAETLDCPACRSGCGLVAFVDEAVDRRVITGRLGCPLCEVEYPIRGGTIDFDPSTTPASLEMGSAVRGEPSPELGLRIAALLGLGDGRGSVVLLGPGLWGCAIELAQAGGGVEVLAWHDPEVEPPPASLDELAVGIDPIRGLSDESWPVRSGSLHGVALLGLLAARLAETERCVRPGGRLVALNPAPQDLERLASSCFEALASDDQTWVGERR